MITLDTVYKNDKYIDTKTFPILQQKDSSLNCQFVYQNRMTENIFQILQKSLLFYEKTKYYFSKKYI